MGLVAMPIAFRTGLPRRLLPALPPGRVAAAQPVVDTPVPARHPGPDRIDDRLYTVSVSFDTGKPNVSNRLFVNALVYALTQVGKARECRSR